MNRAAALLALAVAACAAPSKPARPVGLKIPLPEGWHARAAKDDVLEVAIDGRVVMSMKVEADAALPPTAELEGAIVKSGGESLGALPLPDGVLLRFRVAFGAEGVLGLRRLAGHRVLCASEPAATQAELKTVARLCTDAEWEA